jgi:t-SNARE complex subunit (syntaxin)
MQYTEDATSTYILNECEAIKIGLDSLEPSFQHASKHSESLLNNTASTLRSLEARFNVVLSNPESKTPKNEPQVSLVKRRLKEAHLECLKVESSLRKRLQADVARRYGIANPDATETQIKEAVEDLDVSILNQNVCTFCSDTAADLLPSYSSPKITS